MFRNLRYFATGVQRIPQCQFHLQHVKRQADQTKTLYELLALTQYASKEEIKEAYAYKYMQYEQGLREGKTTREKILPYEQAYRVLIDDANRAEYDFYLKKVKQGSDFDPRKDPPGPGIESMFADTSQEYYRYPLYYSDPLLREEATKVWARHLRMQTMDDMARSDPKKLKRSVVLTLLAIVGLSGLFHVFMARNMTENRKQMEDIDVSRITMPSEGHVRRQHYMPKDVYYDEATRTYRKKKPIDPFSVDTREKREVVDNLYEKDLTDK